MKRPKVLIVRFSSIGDIVLTTPVVRCLHQQIGAEVHYLTKPGYVSLLESPYIHKVIPWGNDTRTTLKALKQEQYDVVIDLHKNLRSLRVKLMLGVKNSSFQKLNFEKWLLVNTGINRLPKVHIVDRYMEAVRAFGVKYDGQGLDYFIPEQAEVNIKTHFDKPLLSTGFVALVLGATHATKRLPPEKLTALCDALPHYSIVLLGGQAESGTAKTIMDQSRHPALINACGSLTLHQSASVLAQSGVVITHDTGLMHIAAALRKPIISVWGSTIPEFGMYPFYPDNQDQNTTIQTLGLSCRPCSKIGHAVCPKGHFKCMQNIDIGNIQTIVQNILK